MNITATLSAGASTRALGFLLAAGGTLLYSGKAILAKYQYQYGLDVLDVVALRLALSLPLFVALAVHETRRARVPLTRRDVGLILLLGTLAYLASLLDFWGLQYVPVSLERLILFLNPTFVLLLGLFVFRHRVARNEWWAVAVSYAGMVLVFVERLRVDGEYLALGSGLVLLSALTYAVYLALSGQLVQRIGALRLVAWAMLVSTAATLIHYGLAREPAHLLQLPAPAYGYAVVNAVFCAFLPITMTMAAIARIGAGNVAQLAALGPVSLLFLGSWLLGETVTPLQVLGTTVVLVGMWLLTRPAANSVPLATAAEAAD